MINRERILAATSKAKSEYDGFSRSTQLLVIIGFAGLLLLGVAETWRMSDEIRQETDVLVEQINRTSNAKSNLRPAFRNQVQALGSMRLPDRKLSTLAAERNIFNSLTVYVYLPAILYGFPVIIPCSDHEINSIDDKTFVDPTI